MDIFEKASRDHVRVPTIKGERTNPEDLWDMSLQDLDNAYKTLNAKLKTSQEDSLLGKKTAADEVIALQVAIIKRVVEVKLQELEARKAAKERQEKRQQILEALDSAENAALKGKTPEELRKMLSELDV